jgi:response regulator RpfG family c-di-GMP phosphodiesterase
MTNKILLVDDDIQLLEGLQRSLRRQFNVETAVGGAEGLNKIASNGPFALIVSDMQMPGMSGLEFLRQVQVQAPNAVRLMLTGNADQKTAVDAVNDGRVFRFLTKPCPAAILGPVLEAGLEQFRLENAERDLLENTLGGALKVLTEILSMIDPATFERGQRLRDCCRHFADAVGFTVTWETEIAAMLLSIGRVTIPPSVLEKVRQHLPLDTAENQLLRQVPELGARLLEKIPRLENVVAIVRYQHKHFDGTGFPERGPSGADIPLSARLLKFLGDLMDLETQGLSRTEAWRKLQDRAGCYDPDMLMAAARWCEVVAPETAVTLPPEEVEIERLHAGQVLAQDVTSTEGLFLLAAGTALTSMLVAKLNNFRRLQIIGRTLLVYSA